MIIWDIVKILVSLGIGALIDRLFARPTIKKLKEIIEEQKKAAREQRKIAEEQRQRAERAEEKIDTLIETQKILVSYQKMLVSQMTRMNTTLEQTRQYVPPERWQNIAGLIESTSDMLGNLTVEEELEDLTGIIQPTPGGPGDTPPSGGLLEKRSQ